MKEIKDLTLEDISSICDHTYLNRPEAFLGKSDNPVRAWRDDFNLFLEKSIKLPFAPYALCVRHDNVGYVKKFLEKNNSNIKVVATAGFPVGSDYSTNTKKHEVLAALEDGADEVDFVMNYTALKDGYVSFVCDETNNLNRIIHDHGAVSKTIIETSELNIDQVKLACNVALYCGSDFVKTSTGFSSSGARIKDLIIMREKFSGGVKMSGFVKKHNVYDLLLAASGRNDGMIDLKPMKVRIGESSLISSLME